MDQADCFKSFVEVSAEDDQGLIVLVSMSQCVNYSSCWLHAALTLCEAVLFWVLNQLFIRIARIDIAPE